MEISTPKLYLDFYSSLLDDYDKKIHNFLYDKDETGYITDSLNRSYDKLDSLENMVKKLVSLMANTGHKEAFTFYNKNEFNTKLLRLALILNELSKLLIEIDENIQEEKLTYGITALEIQITKIGKDCFQNLSNDDFGFNKLMQTIHYLNKKVIEDNPTSEEIETINDNIATYLISINRSYDTFKNLGFIESITDDKYYLLDPSENSSKCISDFKKVHILPFHNEDFKFKRNNTTSNS